MNKIIILIKFIIIYIINEKKILMKKWFYPIKKLLIILFLNINQIIQIYVTWSDSQYYKLLSTNQISR